MKASAREAVTGVDCTARRAAIVVSCTLLASYAYFYQGGGWNQNSRFALVRAIVEHRTLRIDEYASSTGDRALWNDHYYSDKAPGASLVAVVPVAAAAAMARVVGVPPASRAGVTWTSYIATVATSGVFTVAAALCVLALALEWRASRAAAIVAALAYGLATPAWPYATLFIGHAVTAGCLMAGFTAAVIMNRSSQPLRLAWLVGLACGWASVTEFPAAIPAAIIVAIALATGGVHRGGRWGVALRLLAGVALALACLAAYNAAAFGSPFRIGYASEEAFEGMRRGVFGISTPRLDVAYGVLFGRYRGLLRLAPIAAFAPVGLVLLMRSRHGFAPALVALMIGAYYLVLNASYIYWEGGWSYGPRHLSPSLPFVALGAAPVWDSASKAGRMLLVVCCVWGAALSLIAVSTTAQPPGNLQSPVHDFLWPAFRAGDLSVNHQSFVDYAADPDRLRGGVRSHAAWNVGELLGLRGLWSLLPLAGIWGVAAWSLTRDARTPLAVAAA